ncbi:MAG: CopD family protein, partial [Gemmatimonadales bacterium]
ATGLPAAGRLGYPGTALHLAAAAAWLGTLGVLWYATLGRATDRNAHPAVVGAFSPLGLGAGLTAMAAGGIVAWRYVGSIEALTGSLYGRTLILKVAVLGVVALTGAVNWRVILPRLRRGEPAPIGRTAAVELLVGLVLLAVTAVLVSLAAPGEHE